MNETAVGDDWMREEFERAKARNAQIPKWARVTFNLPKREPDYDQCRCGHPGSGCVCRGGY